jgi:quinol monooxygenase YgiN
MSRVTLSGRLVCVHEAEAAIVAQHLPGHVRLTKAEPGCVLFEVRATRDPLVWEVEELFASREAFEVHQKRVKASDWGRATAAIRRDYRITSR